MKLKIAKLKIEPARTTEKTLVVQSGGNSRNGFTLVELIISVGLFVTVITIGLGAVLSIFDANSKSQSVSSVMNNLNYSLDSMTRDIRFSSKYHCGSATPLDSPNSCPNGDTFLAVSTSSPITVYQYNSTTKTIEKSTTGGPPYTPIIGGEVTITYAQFYVFNTIVGDNRQPYVLFVIRGFAGKKPSTQSTFDLETVISQRQLDI